MTAALLWIGAAAVSAAVTARTAAFMARGASVVRRNYRGVDVPATGGMAPLAGITAGLAFVSFVHAVAPSAPTLRQAATHGIVFVAVALGFGLLGLWDDVAAGTGRGWRDHLRAALRLQPTSGALKIGAGGALALIAVAPRRQGFGWILVDAAIVALSANLFNLLDVRPGRSLKGFGLAAVPLLAFGGPTAPALAAGLGAAAGFLRVDLRERAMLGDAGAMGLGAVTGYAIVALGAEEARLAVLGAFVILHVVGDGRSLSRAIDVIPPLRALDRLGRVPEGLAPEPTRADASPPSHS